MAHPTPNSVEAKIIEELQQLFLELQKQGKLPPNMMKAEKDLAIRLIAQTIMSFHLKDPLAFVKDQSNHNRLGLALLAQIAINRGHKISPEFIKTLLTPEEELEKNPQKRQELKNVIRELLEKLRKNQMLELENSVEKTAEGILSLPPQEMGNMLDLLLKATLVSLYGFDPSGMSTLVSATSSTTDSLGIALPNLFVGENNALTDSEKQSDDARAVVSDNSEVAAEAKRHFRSPFDISNGPKLPG